MPRNNLHQVLKAHGLTQKAFADKLGTSPQYVSAICSGKLTASVKKLQEIADLLGVSLYDLLVDECPHSIFVCPHCGRAFRVMTLPLEEEQPMQAL